MTRAGSTVRCLPTRRAALLAAPLLLLPGCAPVDRMPPAATVTLTVVTSPWSGWSREQPGDEASAEEVTRGTTFTRSAMGEDIVFTVTTCTARRVVLRTDTPLSEREGVEGIDLGTDQDTFTVRAGETLKVTTPTMDAGTTFEISIAG
jgi:hypothetical protein